MTFTSAKNSPDGDFPPSSVERPSRGRRGRPRRGLPDPRRRPPGPRRLRHHANQPGPLADGARQIAESLAAFQRDLEKRGLAGRVLTLVWSEFGRRAAENASNGTDHGAAAVAFLMGTRVRACAVGEFPGLARGLDGDGNLRATTDFRAVYASLVEQWFDVDAARILPDAKRMPRYPLVR